MRENLSIPDLDLQENIREIRERVGLAAEKAAVWKRILRLWQ